MSTTDPAARMMRMADDATRPCYNIQVATACSFIVGLSPTDQCNDHDLAGEMTRGDIIGLDQTHPALVVYAPPVVPKPAATPQSQNRCARNLAREASCLKHWRARMTTPQAKAIYARRCLTEHVDAKIKNRGFGRMLVRGLARVCAVCLLHALTRRAALAAA